MLSEKDICDKDRIVCTVSGGSDSDVLIDVLSKKPFFGKIIFVCVRTGLDWKCLDEHNDYLEKRYGIKIIRFKPKLDLPTSIRKYGQPFKNKQTTRNISNLQRHNFTFENGNCDDFLKHYTGIKSELEYWCNRHGDGKDNRFNISNNKYLKEFIIENKPKFRIYSSCDGAKKKAFAEIRKLLKPQVEIFGVRKAEGGVRATAYKEELFVKNGVINYIPLFFMTNEDKRKYIIDNKIIQAKAYTLYGLKRTGCVGCPFSRTLLHELEIAKKHEPEMYNLVMDVFKDTYDYTFRYQKYINDMKEKEKINKKLTCKGKFLQTTFLNWE